MIKHPVKPTSPLRLRAEDVLDNKDASATPVGDQLLHELQVHQVELQMQNEELRQAQLAVEESRSRYADLFDFAPVGYLTLTRRARIEAINLAGAELLGMERPKLIDQRFVSFISDPDLDHWRRVFDEIIQQRDRRRCDLRIQRADGITFSVQIDCQFSPRNTGTVLVAMTNASERMRTEKELRLAALAFEAETGIAITDHRAVIVLVNRAFTRLTGYSAQEAIGRTPSMLGTEIQTSEFEERVRRELAETGYWQGEIWNRHNDGRRYAAWLTISAVRWPDATALHYVGTFSEITTFKEAEAELNRFAYYDPLTHLPNRRLLYDRIGQAMAASARSKLYGAVIFLDLDHFKTFNDSRGHDLGDRLLIEVAQRIEAELREVDTVARLGGDEFVVILEHLNVDRNFAATEGRRIAEKIRASLDKPYTLGGARFRCAASLGVALFRGHEQSIEALLHCADLAMYEAKRAGRNTLLIYRASPSSRNKDNGGKSLKQGR